MSSNVTYNEILKEYFPKNSIKLTFEDLRELAKKPFEELKAGMPFLPKGMKFSTDEEIKEIRNAVCKES